MHFPLFGNVIAFFFLLKSQDILLEGVGQMVNLASLDYKVGHPSIKADICRTQYGFLGCMAFSRYTHGEHKDNTWTLG